MRPPVEPRPAEAKPLRHLATIGLIALMFAVGVAGGRMLRHPVRSPRGTSESDSTASQQPAPPVEATAPDSAAVTAPIDLVARRQAEQQFGELFRRGYRNFHTERYALAAEDLQQAVRIAPHLAEGHYYLGEVYRKLYRPEQAESAYRESLKQMADFRPAQEKLAMLLHEQGRFEEALQLLTAMQRQSPDDPFVIGEQAINWLALGQPQRAATLLEQYNAGSGRQAWGYGHLGRAREQLGDLEEAARLYREAIEIDPNFAVVHHWLGLLLVRQGQELQAHAEFAAYDRLRKLENTEYELKMALLRDADNVKVLVRLAQTRFELGRSKDALQTLERARQIAPDNPELARLQQEWSRGASPAGSPP